MSIAELRKLPDDEDSHKSPSWHEGELRQTVKDLEAGEIEILDWEDAKKELRAQFE